MQAITQLPTHPLPLEKPSPSKIITDNAGKDSYTWKLTESERSHIADMLNIKYRKPQFPCMVML
ncbi:hypothetical protein Asppvi_003924 [Aspergillus pseudoviridinutans]|uniref:Uncharacterized protein n=1 Tax=Aspergillus pseudoviridinutans TaxID=1517512 RepID=A0A9P3B7X7_9EURO|nr:uncharacterized protein Asppvi_003924 [Aspergillus pseudoviridinutans]GIJ85069.1 hypothetical protein Asppvi_003924 [Aspergillus pseudoviridinutans]